MVDAELLEHPAIQNNEEWSALAKKAHQALFDLYQLIGQSTGAVSVPDGKEDT